MSDRLDGARILVYSHDTFGLGHLRRCRAIAHALVERYKGLSVLILSGSPIIGSFDFRARVDFVRVPGVIKLHNGEYTSLALHIDLEQTLAIRESIIQHTAKSFAPDMLLVDKEPLGLKGEVLPTLAMLKERGTTCILGLRDVLDDPQMLQREWDRKNVVPALERYYDEIWIYGLPQIADPLSGIGLSADVRRRMVYTGYLPRSIPQSTEIVSDHVIDEPYVLVTTGGGGDGAGLVDWVLRAYERCADLPYRAVVVLGPFMQPALQKEFLERVACLPNVEALTFDTHLEVLMERAAGVVAMGGYNTFCEILSLDKPAVIVPRTRPRQEQFIRGSRAEALGLIRLLDGDGPRKANEMAAAIRGLAQQPVPSKAAIPGLLDGLETVNRLTEGHILGGHVRRLSTA
jgi:predicted glycosyltransferase